MSPFDRRQLRVGGRSRFSEKVGFLAHYGAEQLLHRLRCFSFSFQRVLIIGKFPKDLADSLLDCPEAPPQIIHALFESHKERHCKNIFQLQADEEHLPFSAGSFDLIIANMTLHWVNDVPGVLQQIQQLLRPGGLFLCAFCGGNTLCELQQSFLAVESDRCSGASQRVGLFMDLATASRLVQGAGFVDPVADRDPLTVTYSSVAQLFNELRAMGETNLVINRYKGLTLPKTLSAMMDYYQTHHSIDHGRIRASFEVFYLQGWKL